MGITCSAAGSYHGGAPWWLCLLFGVAGLLFTICVTELYRKVAYSRLGDQIPGWLELPFSIFYMLFSMIVLGSVCAVCVMAAEWATAHLGYLPRLH